MSNIKGSKRLRPRKSEYVIAIIINLILLYLANNLLTWDVPYLTRSFADTPLFVLNISIIATLAANMIFLVFDPAWFTALTRAVLNVISIIFLYVFLTVFPLNVFNESTIFWIKVVLALGIAGTAIAFFVELYRFIKSLSA